jgi:hypothetical protein
MGSTRYLLTLAMIAVGYGAVGCATAHPDGAGPGTNPGEADANTHSSHHPDAHITSVPDAPPQMTFPDANLCGTVELCNGVDDNCNGQIDEGYNVGAPCSAGVGACMASGSTMCAPGGATTTCSAVPLTPAPAEICGNGIDDDCNGVVDDGCTTGGGTCAHNICTAGAPLDPSCDPCATAVCAADAYCCDPTGMWDSICVSETLTFCTASPC